MPDMPYWLTGLANHMWDRLGCWNVEAALKCVDETTFCALQWATNLKDKQKICDGIPYSNTDICIAVSRAVRWELKDHVVEAVECPNANHVLQQWIRSSSLDDCAWIVQKLAHGFCKSALAKHRYGCRVIQRLLERDPALLTLWIEPLLLDVRALSQHRFANYVMQKLLETGPQELRQRLVDSLFQLFDEADQHEKRKATSELLNGYAIQVVFATLKQPKLRPAVAARLTQPESLATIRTLGNCAKLMELLEV